MIGRLSTLDTTTMMFKLVCMYDPNGKYKIVRFYFKGRSRTIKRGLTLEQAQAHCNDPETSSRTCTKAAGKRRTQMRGPWFDGFDDDCRC